MFYNSNLMIMWQGIYFYTNLAKTSDWLKEGSLPWEPQEGGYFLHCKGGI